MKGYKKKKKKKIIFSSHWSTDSRMYSAGDEMVGVWWHILTGIPLCARNVMPPKGEIKKKKKVCNLQVHFKVISECDVKFRIGFLREISLENVYAPRGIFGFASPHWKAALFFNISMLFTPCI